MTIRFNKAIHAFELGYYYAGRFGSWLWHHVRFFHIIVRWQYDAPAAYHQLIYGWDRGIACVV